MSRSNAHETSKNPVLSGPPESLVDRSSEAGEVHLVYKIEGTAGEVPVFELARTLEALGHVIEEGDHILNGDAHGLVVRVRPFEEGSFLMDLVLSVQNNPAVLFFLTHPEAIARIKTVLEYLGFVKKGQEILTSLLELVEFLKKGKPSKIEHTSPEVFNYYNQDGQVMPVNQPVHKLINNGTIQQYFFPAVAAPLQRDAVEAITTFLANQELETAVRVPKEQLQPIKAYSEPEPTAPREEVVENITTAFLNPKAGTYGDTEGTWIFTKAGSNKNPFRARISDDTFLARFGRGAIRFYHDDVLKVRLKSEERFKNGKSRTTHEIVEVIDYQVAPVKVPRRRK